MKNKINFVVFNIRRNGIMSVFLLFTALSWMANGAGEKNMIPPNGTAVVAKKVPQPEQIPPPSKHMFQTKTSDGVTISGSYAPAAASDKPTVVLIQDETGDRDAFNDFSSQLGKQGYGILTYDNRGKGKSTQKRNPKGNREWLWKNDGEGYRKMVGDLGEVLKAYKKETGVEDNQIVLVGAGLGANIAINYAAQNPDLGGTVLLSLKAENKGIDSREAMDGYIEQGRPVLMVYAWDETSRVKTMNRRAYQKATDNDQILLSSPEMESTMLLRHNSRDRGAALLSGEDEGRVIEWIGKFGVKKDE